MFPYRIVSVTPKLPELINRLRDLAYDYWDQVSFVSVEVILSGSNVILSGSNVILSGSEGSYTEMLHYRLRMTLRNGFSFTNGVEKIIQAFLEVYIVFGGPLFWPPGPAAAPAEPGLYFSLFKKKVNIVLMKNPSHWG
jgi:hypothetical protein